MAQPNIKKDRCVIAEVEGIYNKAIIELSNGIVIKTVRKQV
jgi:hypothetical protein